CIATHRITRFRTHRRLPHTPALLGREKMSGIGTPWALVLVTLLTGSVDPPLGQDPWKPYRFLAGEWTGEGSGDPGKGSGGFSFAWDLQGKVLVRRNRSEYPATNGRPAMLHEDLMVIYQGEGGGPTRVIYFDSEGHVINYTATFAQDQRTLT